MAPHLQVAVAQMVAEATYRSIAEVLARRGIDHLLLKGPHLGAIAYDEAWQRAYCDLDVLVRAGQFLEAAAALTAADFSLRTPPAGRGETIAVRYNWGFVAPSGMAIELHRQLSGYGLFPVDQEGLFDRAVEFPFGQTVARGLALEDLVVHLVIHAAKGHFRDMAAKHVEDVGRLTARQPVAWEVFLARAREARCRTAAWVLLSAARRIHGAAVPEEVLARLRPSLLRRCWLGAWLRRDRFPLFRFSGMPFGLGRALVGPALADRLWDAVTVGLRYLAVRVRDVVGRGQGRPVIDGEAGRDSPPPAAGVL